MLRPVAVNMAGGILSRDKEIIAYSALFSVVPLKPVSQETWI
jgi:hypothetical protein